MNRGSRVKGDRISKSDKNLLEAIQYLPTRERNIIRLRYGLDGSGQRTLQQTADKLGMTRERVRMIERETEALLTKI